MARRPTYRPWTRLIALAVLIIAAYATIVGAGYKPKLGLDLAGGTTVTLQPKLLNGKNPPSNLLDQAVDIIRQRVNGKGVGGATVVKQYPYVVVAVPGSNRSDVLNTISRTAQLYFRQVATGCPSGTSASASANCVTPDESLYPPAVLKSLTPTPPSTAQPAPSGSSSVSPPAQASASPAGSPLSSAATVSSAPKVAPAAPITSATAHGRPVPAALAATPTAVATPTAPSPPASAGQPATAPSLAPAPAPTANGGIGPLPPGNGQIVMTQAQATTAFASLKCGVPAQRNRVADFAPNSWALGCGTGYPNDASKYLLLPAAVRGTSVSSADAEPITNNTGTTSIATGGWQVVLSFKDSAFFKFTQTTAGDVKQGAIVLDGIVESAPTNQTAIDTNAQISGNFTQASATQLANVLKYGSLPLSFKDAPTSQTVSPTLGKSSLNAGLLAGILGLAIVVIYCFLYYRALGIVTVASLVVSGGMVYAAVVLLGQAIGFTLSLSGIAGFIVAIGITADSFVVFYERIKDEVRDGKRPRSAVESGWRAARRTIISADAVSILAALVLYVVSIGDVRGFALTLGLSTVLDLVTVFFFTKPLVTILIQRELFSSGKLSGLSSQGPQAPLRRRRPSTPSATAAMEAS